MLAAGFNENPDVIATLLHAGANVNAQNKDGMTALTWAAEYNPNSMVTHMLISAGANVETQTIGLSQTALMLAAAYTSNPEVVTILLDAGAAGNIKSKENKVAFDYAQGNENLKGTEAYQQLQRTSQ